MSESSEPVVLIGLIRPREHCTFTWEAPDRGGPRTARIRSTHCRDCIADLRALGYLVVREETAGGPDE